MSDWVQRALSAYQAKVDEENAQIAKVRQENIAALVATVSWLLEDTIDPAGGYCVGPNSYRIQVTHPDHPEYPVVFTLIGEDRIIGVVHTCDRCREDYATPTRSAAELGEVLVEGKPEHSGCKAASPTLA